MPIAMKRHVPIKIVLLCLLAVPFPLVPGQAVAADHDFRGQASAWITGSSDGGEHFHNGGIRYIPRYTFLQPIDGERFFDLEVSLNGWAAFGSAADADDADLGLYRLIARFATARTETRIGLQKINFGPAFLLRALMWFDSLDPRDPLQLTDGVYAARFRYVAMNNAGFWLWGLYGNDETKGYEILQSEEERPEFGGRLQLPVPRGEIGITFHNREVDGSILHMPDFTENRFALDGRWDIEIGLWFEAVLQQQKIGDFFVAASAGAGSADDLGIGSPYDWVKIMMLGADYTLNIGNGIHVLCEHMVIAPSNTPFGWNDDRQTSACSINYPVGYLDTISAIGFYSWESREYYQYLAWQRTWDDFILKLGLFHYPDSNVPGGLYRHRLTGTGYGGQVTVIFNH
ncbi:MAG TPA: hypothetical protein VMX58_01570 [Patescibacteria group bacterium]|nr:hypothetical protein [Patescibacteria group bacterium]